MTAHGSGEKQRAKKEELSTEDREIKMLESKLGLSSGGSSTGLKKLQKCVYPALLRRNFRRLVADNLESLAGSTNATVSARTLPTSSPTWTRSPSACFMLLSYIVGIMFLTHNKLAQDCQRRKAR